MGWEYRSKISAAAPVRISSVGDGHRRSLLPDALATARDFVGTRTIRSLVGQCVAPDARTARDGGLCVAPCQ